MTMYLCSVVGTNEYKKNDVYLLSNNYFTLFINQIPAIQLTSRCIFSHLNLLVHNFLVYTKLRFSCLFSFLLKSSSMDHIVDVVARTFTITEGWVAHEMKQPFGNRLDRLRRCRR
jgi:hypothetical protein